MMTLAEKIRANLCRKKEHETFAKEKILPLFDGWNVQVAIETLNYARREIECNAIVNNLPTPAPLPRGYEKRKGDE